MPYLSNLYSWQTPDSQYFAPIIGYTGKISQDEYDALTEKQQEKFTLRSSLKGQMFPFLDMLSWRDPWGCPGLSWLYKSNASERRHSWWNVRFVLSIDFQNKVKFLLLFVSVCECFSYKTDFKLIYERFFEKTFAWISGEER